MFEKCVTVPSQNVCVNTANADLKERQSINSRDNSKLWSPYGIKCGKPFFRKSYVILKKDPFQTAKGDITTSDDLFFMIFGTSRRSFYHLTLIVTGSKFNDLHTKHHKIQHYDNQRCFRA